MFKKINKVVLVTILVFCLLPFTSAAAIYKGASSWAVPELDKAAGYGLITDRIKDNVSANLTREEFAEITVRLYEKCTGKKAATGNASFSDTKNPEILKAANLGMVNGVGGGKFAPKLLLTREQMAAILLRAIKAISPASDLSTAGVSRFADDKSIHSWARDGVYYCAKNIIIKGVGGNKFNPLGNSTREAAIIVTVRSYELYKSASEDTFDDNQGNITGETGNNSVTSTEDLLVINDFIFDGENLIIEEKNQETFIYIPLEDFKFAFTIPYAGYNKFPDVINDDGNISIIWKNSQDELLVEVNMSVDSPEAFVNNQQVDIYYGPYSKNGKIMIPVNLFVEILDMKFEEFLGRMYLVYDEDFSNNALVGTWNYSSINVFTGVKDLTTGLVSLPSFDTSYTFNEDGTYHLGMVGSGGLMEDTLIFQNGKYKVIGNTIIFYDVIETLYKGNPFKLIYKDKHKDAPEYGFIDNYDVEEDKIEIEGSWLHRN